METTWRYKKSNLANKLLYKHIELEKKVTTPEEPVKLIASYCMILISFI